MYHTRTQKSFFRSVNTIFGKVGRTAPEEVTLQLIFFYLLLFVLESVHLSKSDMKSLDFCFNGWLMKLFKTTNIIIINDCRYTLVQNRPVN